MAPSTFVRAELLPVPEGSRSQLSLAHPVRPPRNLADFATPTRHELHGCPAPRLRAGEDALPDVRHAAQGVHGTRRSPPGPPDDAAARGPRPSRCGDHEGPHHVHLTPVYVHQIPPQAARVSHILHFPKDTVRGQGYHGMRSVRPE